MDLEVLNQINFKASEVISAILERRQQKKAPEISGAFFIFSKIN